MSDTKKLQKSLIAGALHGLRNTISLLNKLSSHNPENTDLLKKLFVKSEEMLLFFRTEINQSELDMGQGRNCTCLGLLIMF